MVDKEELKTALYRAAVAEKIADKALDMALRALTKVEAMEKSTHKAYFVNPQQGIEEQLPQQGDAAAWSPGANMPAPGELDAHLDKLFESSREQLDDSIDVFSEGD